MTSGGWAMTSFASAASCSPPMGSTGQLRFFASAKRLGIFERLIPCVAQNVYSIRGHVRRRGPRPAKLIRRHDQGGKTAVGIPAFVAIHQVIERRRFRQQRIAFAAGLHEAGV